jgi:hypothetical protein
MSAEHEELLVKAKEDANELRANMMKKARDEVEVTKIEWQNDLQRQRDELISDLRNYSGRQFYTITRRALRDLASEDLERQIMISFINCLNRLDESDGKVIKNFLRSLSKSSLYAAPLKSRGHPAKKSRELLQAMPDLM